MRIYLDHAATSPLTKEARNSMIQWLDSANASTLYAEGRAAKQAVDEARETLSKALGSEFAEVIFTSGGTESASLAMIGNALASQRGERNRILISAAEHHCVLHTQRTLEALGFMVESVPVDREARLDLNALHDLLRDDVLIVAAMHANNELGTINDIPGISKLCQEHGVLLFCDAVQSFGKTPLTVAELGVDLLSVSAHKIGGPKGAGALYVRAGTKLKPLIAGGGQERELRAGTENVAAIAGFSAAVRHTHASEDKAALRDNLLAGLVKLGAVPTVRAGTDRLPTHAHVRFPGVSAETLLIVFDRLGLSAGSGAACSSGSIEPSHVLLACGYSLDQAKEGLRLTLGPETTSEEIEIAVQWVGNALVQVRNSKV